MADATTITDDLEIQSTATTPVYDSTEQSFTAQGVDHVPGSKRIHRDGPYTVFPLIRTGGCSDNRDLLIFKLNAVTPMGFWKGWRRIEGSLLLLLHTTNVIDRCQ